MARESNLLFLFLLFFHLNLVFSGTTAAPGKDRPAAAVLESRASHPVLRFATGPTAGSFFMPGENCRFSRRRR